MKRLHSGVGTSLPPQVPPFTLCNVFSQDTPLCFQSVPRLPCHCKGVLGNGTCQAMAQDHCQELCNDHNRQLSIPALRCREARRRAPRRPAARRRMRPRRARSMARRRSWRLIWRRSGRSTRTRGPMGRRRSGWRPSSACPTGEVLVSLWCSPARSWTGQSAGACRVWGGVERRQGCWLLRQG
jgi:hypothetical protein